MKNPTPLSTLICPLQGHNYIYQSFRRDSPDAIALTPFRDKKGAFVAILLSGFSRHRSTSAKVPERDKCNSVILISPLQGHDRTFQFFRRDSPDAIALIPFRAKTPDAIASIPFRYIHMLLLSVPDIPLVKFHGVFAVKATHFVLE